MDLEEVDELDLNRVAVLKLVHEEVGVPRPQPRQYPARVVARGEHHVPDLDEEIQGLGSSLLKGYRGWRASHPGPWRDSDAG